MIHKINPPKIILNPAFKARLKKHNLQKVANGIQSGFRRLQISGTENCVKLRVVRENSQKIKATGPFETSVISNLLS